MSELIKDREPWQLIAQKQKENAWGNGSIEQLANDLKAEFPQMSGF